MTVIFHTPIVHAEEVLREVSWSAASQTGTTPGGAVLPATSPTSFGQLKVENAQAQLHSVRVLSLQTP